MDFMLWAQGNVSLTKPINSHVDNSICRRLLVVPVTSVAMSATMPRFAPPQNACATTASSQDTSLTSVLSRGRLRPSSATTVKDWVMSRPTARL